MIIGIVGVIIVTLDAVTIAYGSRRRPVGSERVVAGEGDEVAVGALTVSDIATEHSAAYFREVGGFVAWVAGYVALIVLLGFTLATAVFLLSYLRLSAKWGYFATVVGVVVTVGLLAVLSSTFGIDWPDGVFSSL